jgi:hypothetical protein
VWVCWLHVFFFPAPLTTTEIIVMSDTPVPPPLPLSASTPETPNPQAPKSNKGIGCLGIIILLCVIGWIADMAGCNSTSPAFDAGYQVGMAAGKVDGAPGRTAPSQDALHSAARRYLKDSDYANASEGDQEKYTDGFEGGYEVGFKEASKPAF